MKFLIVSLALVAVAAAQQGQQQPVAILRQAQDVSPEGSYSFTYETENGISHAESGSPVVVGSEGETANVVQGQYQYTSPDGSPIALTYVADQNGFQPQGAHLPVAPPVPALIQKAIEYIQAHPPKPEQ